MALLTLKWPSASTRGNRVSRGVYCGVTEAEIRRRRSLSSPQERRREKPRDMIGTRWRTTKKMSVSGSKPKFQPKPPQGGRRSEHDRSVRQESKSMDINIGTAQSQNTLPVPAQRQSLCVSSQPETSSNTVNAEITSVPIIVREDAASRAGLRLLSTGGCYAGAHEALPRSGSAPSSSAMAITNPFGSTCLSSYQPTDEIPSLLGAQIKMGCSTSDPEGNFVTDKTRSCWDDRRDCTVRVNTAVDPVDAARLPPRHDSVSTTGNKATRSTVSEGQQNGPKSQPLGPSNSSTRNGGFKGLHSGSVLPLLSPELELLSEGIKARKKRLVPLRRRTSDIAGGGVRARASNGRSITRASTSAGSDSSRSKRRSSAPGLRSPDTSRPSTSSSTNSARERASSGRRSRSSDPAIGLGADQGHLKARLRVMEWKRRRQEEIKTQQEELVTLEQLQQKEAETEAARKLAAARAEETERRMVVERESTADAVRAAESMEKWEKASRQRERRRAEVYAINAVMRTAFEREFAAYSLIQATRTARTAAPASQDQPLRENVMPP